MELENTSMTDIHSFSTKGLSFFQQNGSSSEHASLGSNASSATMVVLPPQQLLERVQKMARILAKDIVDYRTAVKPPPPVNKHAVTLRRTVDEVSQKHPIVFNSILKKLGPMTKDTLPSVFLNVLDEMLRDCQYNWGRVVSLFAFAASLAQQFNEAQQNELVHAITELLGDYVSKNLSSWITQQGGWDAFDKYFPERNSTEKTIWKGLLYTFVGLGALASVVAHR